VLFAGLFSSPKKTNSTIFQNRTIIYLENNKPYCFDINDEADVEGDPIGLLAFFNPSAV